MRLKGFLFCRGWDGYKDGEGASLPHFAFEFQPPGVVLYNLIADGQPQSRSFTEFFCGEERIEDSFLRFLGDADPSIRKSNFNPGSVR